MYISRADGSRPKVNSACAKVALASADECFPTSSLRASSDGLSSVSEAQYETNPMPVRSTTANSSSGPQFRLNLYNIQTMHR